MGSVSILSDELKRQYYRYLHTEQNGRREPRWRGIRVVKFPSDLILYSQVIQKRTPDWVIETGTRFGGSALFLADMVQIAGGKGVITIDIAQPEGIAHPLLTQITGSSIDPQVVAQVAEIVAGGRVMVTLDSDHSRKHVLAELNAYSKLVTPGQYLVAEDCWTRHETPYEPYYAVEEFLANNPNYRRVNIEKQFIFAVTRDGWLRRMR